MEIILLVLVLVQLPDYDHDVRVAMASSMRECQAAAAQIRKKLPEREGLYYSLSCVKMKSATEREI